jgi:uncharacterized membrane protein YcaP (DUF421 family)
MLQKLFTVDWQAVFVPQQSLFEVFLRGTIMFFGMYTLLRVFRRQSGAVGIADLLVIVIIADAAQNGMAGDSRSVTEALLLITTIVMWDWVFDWLGFRSAFFSRILEPQGLVLIKNGRKVTKNLEKERISDEDLMSQLRQQGIEHLDDVKQCILESNGHFSVITKEDGGDKKPPRSQPDDAPGQ